MCLCPEISSLGVFIPVITNWKRDLTGLVDLGWVQDYACFSLPSRDPCVAIQPGNPCLPHMKDQLRARAYGRIMRRQLLPFKAGKLLLNVLPELRTKRTSLYLGWTRALVPWVAMASAWLLWGALTVLGKSLKMVPLNPLQTSAGTPHPLWTARWLSTFSPSYFQEFQGNLFLKCRSFWFVLVINYGIKCLRDACFVSKTAVCLKKHQQVPFVLPFLRPLPIVSMCQDSAICFQRAGLYSLKVTGTL